MEDEHWSHRDFTQIKPRRPEGTTESEDWESKPFSFIWPLVVGPNNETLEEELHLDGELSKNSRSEEFEFNNVAATVVERVFPTGISPADELFFKGQLLPLHLPPRIQMVKKLSSETQQERERDQQQNAHVAPLKIRSLFKPKFPKFSVSSTDSTPDSSHMRGSSWWDPRERDSSTDRDSTGDSSSSRDSNGSSNDCFDSSKDFQPTALDSKGFLHNREVFSTNSVQPERSNISAWLRPPFKWKVLFGAKKLYPKSSSFPDDKRPALSQVPEYFAGSPLSDRYYSDCSGELSYSGDLTMNARLHEFASFGQGEKDRDQGGMAKAREYLNKYMKILKPVNVKKDNCDSQEASRTVSFNTPAMTTRIPSTSLTFDKRPAVRAISSSRSFSSFSQSSRFSPRDASPRRSGTPHTNVRLASSTSSVSELHSAIQGAIAHCKESHSKQEAPPR